MKTLTLRVWINDDVQEPAVTQFGRLTAAALSAVTEQIRDAEVLTDEQITRTADGIAERAHYQTVQDIISNLKDEIAAGDIETADDAREWIEQTVDGHHDVIYTSCAQQLLQVSRNDSAYFDEMGTSEGAVTNEGINWSVLAYFALLADVRDEIDDLDSWFACQECGRSVMADDLKLAGIENLPTCEDCREPAAE